MSFSCEEGAFISEDLRGFDLHGKILGVVGTGNIDRRVVKLARRFK